MRWFGYFSRHTVFRTKATTRLVSCGCIGFLIKRQFPLWVNQKLYPPLEYRAIVCSTFITPCSLFGNKMADWSYSRQSALCIQFKNVPRQVKQACSYCQSPCDTLNSLSCTISWQPGNKLNAWQHPLCTCWALPIFLYSWVHSHTRYSFSTPYHNGVWQFGGKITGCLVFWDVDVRWWLL
jgi:hypothetical protein